MKYLSLLIALFPLFSSAQSDSAYIRDHYTKSEHLIAMRDGTKLFTVVYVPVDKSRTYPVMMQRTPYSVGPYGKDKYKTALGPSGKFVREGFIFVYQDVRGKYMSEGEFMDVRPINTNRSGRQFDEATDTYDAVDWIVKNVKGNNGKVGFWGVSYPGFYSSMAALSGHPAVRAVSPQAPVTNWFLGDDFHHNGVFFQFDALSFYSGFGKKRPKPTTEGLPGLVYPTPDAYAYYLSLGALKNVNEKLLHDQIVFWNQLMEHPDYDAFWKARDARKYMTNVKPAIMTTGGFFDAEDCWGALETYKAMERNNPGLDNRLVMGPWYHGGWARGKGDFFGDIKFGSATSTWYQENVEFPFFMYHLKGAAKPNLAEALMFDIGADQWREFTEWPTKQAENRNLYFHPNGKISFDAPTGKGFEEYVSDPAKPVPFQDGISNRRSREYMIADQRFTARRPDVLVYETTVLDEDITFAGPINANLFVSITGTDADFVVKIIDVYPDTLPNYTLNGQEVKIGGYQMLLRAETMRGKYRNSFEKPEAFVPNQPTEVKFYLPDVVHTFRKGHKIMIQVQSSWFPLTDRNPQQFLDIYKANDADFIKATHRMYHEAALPSHISVGILR
ncbi:MAG: CocE/NonD family hydrolase [Bacteroidota bacterium]